MGYIDRTTRWERRRQIKKNIIKYTIIALMGTIFIAAMMKDDEPKVYDGQTTSYQVVSVEGVLAE